MATNSARETRELELALKRAVKEKGTRTVDAAEQEALRQLLSKALRSCSPAVAETALVLCSPDSTADKSPLPPPACLEILTKTFHLLLVATANVATIITFYCWYRNVCKSG